MRMVQVAVHDIVDVIAVRDRGMATTRAMPMRARVRSAVVPLCTRVRVLRAHGDDVLVEVVAMNVMKMAVMEIVAMPLVLDDLVTAAFLVLVLVFLVNEMRLHAFSSGSMGSGYAGAASRQAGSPCARRSTGEGRGRGLGRLGACRPAEFRS